MKSSALIAILGTALFISLSLNIFTAASRVGDSFSTAHAEDSERDAQDEKLRASLSDADKAVLKRVMDAHREKITALYNELHGMKKDVLNIVKKEPMDEKSLNAALEEEKSKKLALIWLFHQTRQEAMKEMSPEGRETLSKMARLGFHLSKGECH